MKRAVHFRYILIIMVIGYISVLGPAVVPGMDEDIILTDEYMTEGVVTIAAFNTITAGPDYIIEGADVTFVAGDMITLRPGFTVRKGSTFRASIGLMRGYTVEGDEWWAGRHYIYGDVIISPGSMLDVSSGAEVVFFMEGDGALEVEGTLIVEGGIFTTSDVVPGSWRGIIVEGTGTVYLTGVEIKYARQAVLVKEGAEVILNGCTLRDNLIGVHAFGGHPVIRDCLFFNNGWYAIKEDAGGSPNGVRDSTFSGNGHNYYHEGLGVISIGIVNTLPGNRGNVEQ